MGKLLAVRIYVGHQRVVNIELEVVAVGTDDRLRESNGRVASRPVKCRLQHDLFRRVTLRFVESRGRLWLSEYVGDTVITNAVTRTEIAVRVVIEGAPADPASILRIGGQLVMDAGVPQRVLSETLHLVDRLRGIGVPNEFGVQIPRMVRRFQWKAEIVHGKDVFHKLGFLEVADSTSLATRIEL